MLLVNPSPTGKWCDPSITRVHLKNSPRKPLSYSMAQMNRIQLLRIWCLKFRLKERQRNLHGSSHFPTNQKLRGKAQNFSKNFIITLKNETFVPSPRGLALFGNKAAAGGDSEQKVEVISRQIVGEFDTAIVRENAEGGLNPWLEKEGYETLKNAEDIIGFYRKKKYVFACIKVSSEALKENKTIDSHPLCFSFDTGGRDGIYFPMKMTSLQTEPFDVNLYVFYRYWLNDKLSKYGYRHRGFDLKYRDWDTNRCLTNGGRAWSLPEEDPFLVNLATSVPTVTKFFQNRHPGKKYYPPNIQSKG